MYPHSVYIPEGEEEKQQQQWQQQQINDEKIYCKKPGSDCCFSESKAGENGIEGSGWNFRLCGLQMPLWGGNIWSES